MKKKSLVGWTDEGIWETFNFKLGNLPCLYLCEKKYENLTNIPEINPLKVRITIEELKVK